MKNEDERELVVLMSRIVDIESCADRIEQLVLSKGINWNLVIQYLCKTKVCGLFWRNISLFGLQMAIPSNVRRILEFYYEGNCERNKILIEELNHLLDLFYSLNIKVAPLKGAVLLDRVYIDYGSRQLNDVDLLISKKDINSLNNAFKIAGYQQGNLVIGKNGLEIKPLSRMDEIIWKTKMNNLSPYYKIINSRWCKVVDVDCCFAYDYQLESSFVENIMDDLVERDNKFYIKKEDFFIHLCCHLFKEASNASWALLGTDLNLIKFCDVREFLLREIDSDSWKIICQSALKNGYSKAIFFSIYYMEMIFGKTILYSYKDDLKISNSEFIYEYGAREYGQAKTWKLNFMDRLFEGSKDEVDIRQGAFPLIK